MSTPETFKPLVGAPGVRAGFVPRIAGIDVVTDRATALQRLAPSHAEYLRALGFDMKLLATAEQVHGDVVGVAVKASMHAGADALITGAAGIALGIYVADCAAVYLADREGRAVGLVHSGRAGTRKNIVGKTIGLMESELGVRPADLVVEISPCIRPPLYETDFAAEIVDQAREAGATDVRDCGVCTGRNVDLYYSYRMERGQTGRMLAVLALLS